MKSVYLVKYSTKWDNDRLETNELNVLANDAEHAVEKTKIYNSKENYKDDKGRKHNRIMFKLQGVSKQLTIDL